MITHDERFWLALCLARKVRACYAYSPHGHKKWAAYGHTPRGSGGPSWAWIDGDIYITQT